MKRGGRIKAGVLSGIFKARDKPQNRTAGSGYSFYTGSTSVGKVVTECSAMQMTAVYACVRILSEAIAGLPLHLYRYNNDDGKEKAIDHPLYMLLHDEPNSEMSSFVFRETIMTHLLLWGNAYAQIIQNGKGEVVAFYSCGTMPVIATRLHLRVKLSSPYTVYFSTHCLTKAVLLRPSLFTIRLAPSPSEK